MPLVNYQSWDSNGELVEDRWVDVPYAPLSDHQVVAALNAALGLWSVEDAANIARVPAEHLVAEVSAWAYFAGQG